MSNIPSELKYNTSHEWIRDNEDGTVTIGITDHAQELLGDLVHIDLPEIEAELGAEDAVAVAESVKAASDIYAPMAGTVIEVNEAVLDNPELVNSDPYGDGWLFTLRIDDENALDELMDAETYSNIIEDA